MPVLNSEIAERFDEIADLLEIEAANPFRVRAYRNAARVVGGWPSSLADALGDGGLPKLPGIGKDLAGKIEEMVRTRRMSMLERLRRKTPRGLVELLKIPGLGPKRVKLLSERLKICSADDLRRALRAGKLAEVRGFGPKTEERIIKQLGLGATHGKKGQAAPEGRIPLPVAEQVAAPLLAYLGKIPGIELAIAGSFRRRCESVGDLDILVACRGGSGSGRPATARMKTVRERFLNYEDRAETLASGETKSTILLRSGLQVDLRIVPSESFGAALHYFTGSKAHNIAIRALGVKRGLKINEYGIFRGRKRVGGRSEREVFVSVSLPWIEPELRENRGEIEAAREGRLPSLIRLEQIRGDLHAHTNATDGRLTLEAMAEAAIARGYEYLAITDHSRHLTVARGLDPRRLRQQIRRIDALNEKLQGRLRLLKGIEVDILEDGSLDLPGEVLRLLDLTVCSIHFKFDLSRGKQTERLIRAMDHPRFSILGHPTARLIGSRPAMDFDLEKVMRAARERGKILELNSQPERMDLNDTYCRLAKEMGVKLAISTDAHSAGDLGFIRYGVEQARRGWIEANDVVNALSWSRLQDLLRQ